MSKNVKQTDGPNPQQVLALALLLAGRTQREVANVLDIAEETISRWKHSDPVFIAAYNEGCQALYDASLVELLDLRRDATKALKDIVNEDQMRHADRRLKAAIAILKVDTPPIGDTDSKDITLGLSKKDRDREWAETFNFG
jgi:hypothetical protein